MLRDKTIQETGQGQDAGDVAGTGYRRRGRDRIQEMGYQEYDTGHKAPGTGYRTQWPGIMTQETEHWDRIQDIGNDRNKIHETGHQEQDTGDRAQEKNICTGDIRDRIHATYQESGTGYRKQGTNRIQETGP